MGGKALNKYGVHTDRKNTEEFQRIGKSIRETLSFFFLRQYGIELETAIVTCYHTKSDHGDLDLLIKITSEIESKNIDFRTVIQLSYLPQAIHNNGGVYSFDHKNFQIDFIPIKEEKWETANVYYSYDPLGNIMGKTFHKFGLSYGWDGLFYKFRNFNGRNSQNILLTNDTRRIFDFGGYDYERYLQGFETLEDILKFAIDCKYFDTEIFQMDNLKSIDKKRNRKRGSYHVFLKYLKDNSINVRYDFHKDKELYLPMIDEAFPDADLMGQLYELKMKDREDKILSQKFNGDMVMSWLPNLQGKQLGQAITRFKDELGDNYRKFVLNANYNDIKERFMNTYNGEHK
jgi:hypothetical protein